MKKFEAPHDENSGPNARYNYIMQTNKRRLDAFQSKIPHNEQFLKKHRDPTHNPIPDILDIRDIRMDLE